MSKEIMGKGCSYISPSLDPTVGGALCTRYSLFMVTSEQFYLPGMSKTADHHFLNVSKVNSIPIIMSSGLFLLSYLPHLMTKILGCYKNDVDIIHSAKSFHINDYTSFLLSSYIPYFLVSHMAHSWGDTEAVMNVTLYVRQFCRNSSVVWANMLCNFKLMTHSRAFCQLDVLFQLPA
ncbi:hypothetical protein NE237_033114 [Protea cynaroides]|uniref:Uncharacterized protein n=1 Tax=Protea cynaroides TaxID=273540 RepID=A0A9Q0L4M5_9MAGN|nr:hypothetical protein NE237_033114 [Protea cynaroides]